MFRLAVGSMLET